MVKRINGGLPRWRETIPLSYFHQFHQYDFEERVGTVIDYGEDVLGPLVVVKHKVILNYVRPIGSHYVKGKWYKFNGWVGNALAVNGNIVRVLHYEIKEYPVGRHRIKRVTAALLESLHDFPDVEE